MQRSKSDLDEFVPAWERKLPDFVHDAPLERLLSRDVHITHAPRSENVVRDGCVLAQDIFSARVVRQSTLLKSGEPLPSHVFRRAD